MAEAQRRASTADLDAVPVEDMDEACLRLQGFPIGGYWVGAGDRRVAVECVVRGHRMLHRVIDLGSATFEFESMEEVKVWYLAYICSFTAAGRMVGDVVGHIFEKL